MKANLYLFTCDECGKEKMMDHYSPPQGWETFKPTSLYNSYNDQTLHFCSPKCKKVNDTWLTEQERRNKARLVQKEENASKDEPF